MTVVWLVLGGGLGAVVRDLLGRRLGVQHGIAWSNRVGAALLGILVGVWSTGQLHPDLVTVLGTGFCGGLTTFSSLVVTGVAEPGGRAWVWREVAIGMVVAALAWGTWQVA